MAQNKRKMALYKLLDTFIPDVFKDEANAYTRAQILVGVILINIVTSILTMIGITIWMDLNTFNYIVAYLMGGNCMTLYLFSLFFLRQKAAFLLAGNLTSLAVFSTVFISCAVTGGYSDSPFIQMFILVPVMTFLLVGLNAGIIWSSLTILGLLALLVAEQFFGFYYQLLPAKDAANFSRFLPFVMISMTVFGLVVYELVSDGLKKQLNRERNRFAFKASHDSLTDLPNREEFYLRLRRAIEDAQINQTSTALVYIDLDGFKPINDNFGHHAGDKVLKIVSARLKNLVRVHDTVARLGGDEFALILLGVLNNDDIDAIVAKVLTVVAEPIEISDQEVSVYASAGIALSPHDSTSPEELCQLADWAMYRAKRRKNTYRYVSPKQDAGIDSLQGADIQ